MPIEFDSSKFPHREVIYRDIDFPEAVTRKQSRDADKRAVETFGIPGILLTENAAVAFLHEVREYAVFAIVCGVGNNGGDGLAVARHLCILGKDVRVYIIGDPKKGTEDFKTNLNIMSKLAPETLNTLNEENFEEFYKYNFTQMNALYYFTSTKYPFKVGEATNGTTFVNFKKEYHRSYKEDILSISVKNLEGKYIDNWINHFSFGKLSNLKTIVDEKRKKYYFRGQFQTSLSKGKLLSNQNSLRNSNNCPTLIEAEFPLAQVNIYILNINNGASKNNTNNK